MYLFYVGWAFAEGTGSGMRLIKTDKGALSECGKCCFCLVLFRHLVASCKALLISMKLLSNPIKHISDRPVRTYEGIGDY